MNGLDRFLAWTVPPVCPSTLDQDPPGTERDTSPCPSTVPGLSRVVPAGTSHPAGGGTANRQELSHNSVPAQAPRIQGLKASGTVGQVGRHFFNVRAESLGADLCDLFDERASILEVEAGFPRAEAERRAKVEAFGTALGFEEHPGLRLVSWPVEDLGRLADLCAACDGQILSPPYEERATQILAPTFRGPPADLHWSLPPLLPNLKRKPP